MRNAKRQIRILTSKHRLIVLDGAKEVKSFPIASPMFPESPKYWGCDGRPAFGYYHVTAIHREGSRELERANSIDYLWYRAWTARDHHEAPGKGLYGVGMIYIDYPNKDDLRRFRQAKESGELQRLWKRDCEEHAKPIYEQLARERGIQFDDLAIELDFGERTYQDLLDSFPVADINWAFRGRPVIHGTNDPDCIGTDISSGCIRMHNNDIMELMAGVEIGTPVEIEASDFRCM